MDDTLADLLQRLAGESNTKTQVSLAALADSGLVTVSDLVFATETAGARNTLQEEIANRAREDAVQIPSHFVDALRMAVQESRLAYSGFPEPPPSTSTAILFTAPHALFLQRPGHTTHKPEAYTQHLARDFAQIVGGAFLTWTRREEARAKEFYKSKGVPDPTNADPNFTHCSELGVSSWTRNLREVRCLFGLHRPCLHVDLHGCKDPGPDVGSDLIVGLGAMQLANHPSCSFFKLALGVTLQAIALHGFSVNLEPTKLTGVSPDADRRTLTQQSMTDEGGAWSYAVQLELSRSLRLELSRKREMRFMLAKAVLVAFSLAMVWQHKPVHPEGAPYPLQEVQEWLQTCKAFHAKRSAQVKAAGGAVAVSKDSKVGGPACNSSSSTGGARVPNRGGAGGRGGGGKEKDSEGSKEVAAAPDAEEADFEETVGMGANRAEGEAGGTANTEPRAAAYTEEIEEWWPEHWVRSLKRPGSSTTATGGQGGPAKSLQEWLSQLRVTATGAGVAGEGQGPGTGPPLLRSEVQALREWYRTAASYGHAGSNNEGHLGLMIAKASSVPKQCYIVGTWSQWQPTPMDWDGYHFQFILEIGTSGWESFQIRVGPKGESTVHPSCQDANPFLNYRVQGPDDRGHGKNWTIGIPPGKSVNPGNAAKPGEHYQVLVGLDEMQLPCRVSWKAWS